MGYTGRAFSPALPPQKRTWGPEKGEDSQLVTKPDQSPGPQLPAHPTTCWLNPSFCRLREQTSQYREALAGTKQTQEEEQDVVRICCYGT